MYHNILVATDGSELATKGLDHALKLAKLAGAKVTIITVTDVWSAGALAGAGAAPIAEYETAMNTAVKSILEEAAKFARETGVEFTAEHIPNRYPADAIIETAQKTGADLIVMASHGRRGLRKMLLGSQTTEVLTATTTPVLVVR